MRPCSDTAFGDRLTGKWTSSSTFWQLGIISVKDRAVTRLAVPRRREEKIKKIKNKREKRRKKGKKLSTTSQPVPDPGNGCEGLFREKVHCTDPVQ